jgi:tetrapyrrole methylase family protein/MazG family protein
LDWPRQEFNHLTSILILPLPAAKRKPDFVTLLDIMAHLRDPEKGCPWDKQQTPQKLKRYLIEESYELAEAIDGGDPDKYAEELGDLLLQVAFHAQLAREEDIFDCDDVIRHIVEKLIRRHPHIFGDVSVSSAEEVLTNWEAIKRSEKGYEDRKSILDGIVAALPALMRAMEVSKRAAKAGFEWDSIDGVFEKLDEEVKELREARLQQIKERVAEEIGDLLFTVVNLARFENVDAEEALHRMVTRFTMRFKRIEEAAGERGIALESMTLPEMEEVWKLAKQEQQDAGCPLTG